MIYRDHIVFRDRDGDVLSVSPRRGEADPVITITRDINPDEWERGGEIINSGSSSSVIFTETEFIEFLGVMRERVLGKVFP